MPDPIDQNLPQAPVAPALPNPQDMVDAALSGDTSTPKTEVVEAPKSETLPPLAPLSSPVSEPAEPPVVAPTSAPTTESVTPPTVEPVTPHVTTTPVVAMGDDTPLAFAGIPTPSATPTTDTSVSTPLTPPPIADNPSIQPIVPQTLEPKKKGKIGKIVIGLVSLVLVLFGGVIGYSYISGSSILVAPIGQKENGTAASKCEAQGGSWNSKTGNCRMPPKENENGDGQKSSDTLGAAKECAQQGGNYNVGTGNCRFPNAECSPTDQGGKGCPISCNNTNTSGWVAVTEPGGGSYCNENGEKCTKYRKELKHEASGTHCFVGYGEQCGGSCGGDTPPSAPPGIPVMACTGLTSVPAVTPAPVVGAKLTFTCAGTVTPTTAGTLSYKFRYSINSGTPVALTPLTATPNKAELTINACGTYKVECQACATINSVLTCDPIWTAATQ